jgi:hypothetical protein
VGKTKTIIQTKVCKISIERLYLFPKKIGMIIGERIKIKMAIKIPLRNKPKRIFLKRDLI